jgi:hypothetical protein
VRETDDSLRTSPYYHGLKREETFRDAVPGLDNDESKEDSNDFFQKF